MFKKFGIIVLLAVSTIGPASAQTAQSVINALPHNFCPGLLQEWARAPGTLRVLEMSETRVVRAINAAPRGSGMRVFVHETLTCEPESTGNSVVVRFSWAPMR